MKIIKKKENTNLLNLKGSGFKDFSIPFKSATQNVVCLGSTGSGKTVNVILPAIENVIKNNSSGLIMDVKAEICQDVLQLAKENNRYDDIVFIGTEEYCEDFNLLSSYSNKEQLKGLFSMLRSDKSQNSMWLDTAKNDMLDMVTLWEYYVVNFLNKKVSYDIKTLLSLQNDRKLINLVVHSLDEVCEFLDEYNEEETLSHEIILSYRRVKENPFSIYNAINSVDSTAKEQMEWKSGQIASILGKLCREPFYKKLFNSNLKTTLRDLIFEQNKIVVMVIPQKYSEMGYITAKILRQLYFDMVLGTTPEERRTKRIGDEFNKYLFLIIDEYQKYIETETSDGVITDEEWVGISRSYGNINLFASQSRSSLISGAGSETDVATLLQNCVNTIDLMNKDQLTINYLEWLFCEKNGMKRSELNALINPNSTSRQALCRVIDNGCIKMGKVDFKNSKSTLFYTDKWKEKVRITFDNFKKIAIENNELKSKPPLFISKSTDNFVIIDGKKCWKERFFNFSQIEQTSNFLLDLKIKHEVIHKFMTCPYNINVNANWSDEKKSDLYYAIKNKKKTINFDHLMDYVSRDINNNCGKPESSIFFYGHKSFDTFEDINTKLNIEECFISNNKNEIETYYSKDPEIIKNRDINIKPKIVVVFRGGGDKSSHYFNKYKQIELYSYLRKQFPKAIILSALGHANDLFIFDLLADFTFTTPTDLGVFLAKFKKHKSVSEERMDMYKLLLTKSVHNTTNKPNCSLFTKDLPL
ncbi:hypothetical protein AB4521_11880 [Vibrio cyclitrophicus]